MTPIPPHPQARRSELTLCTEPPHAAVAESVELLDGGGQAYPRMLLAIAHARRSVHLEVYGFAPSGVGGAIRRGGWVRLPAGG